MFKIWAGSLDLLQPQSSLCLPVVYPSERILLLWFWLYDLYTFNHLCGALKIIVCFHVHYTVSMSVPPIDTCVCQRMEFKPGDDDHTTKRSNIRIWLATRFTEFVPKVFGHWFHTYQSATTKQQQPVQAKGQLIVMNGLVGSTRNDPSFIMLLQMVSYKVIRVLFYNRGTGGFLGCRTSKFRTRTDLVFNF